MNLNKPALGNPVAVIVAVLLVLLSGTISLLRRPVQMIPNVKRPMIEIATSWRAAVPEEVEAEIVEPREDALRGRPGLEVMQSSATRGRGSISLTFDVNTQLERALIEVMNRLNRVPSYPLDVDQPLVYAGRGQFGSAIAWFAIRPLPGNDRDITSHQDVAEVSVALRDARGSLNQNGGPSIASNAQPEQNVSVLEAMTEIKEVIAELNEGAAKRAGQHISQDYGETL